MDKSLEKTVNYLNLAIKTCPDKNNCKEIKINIKKILVQIENLSKKNNKRKVVQEKAEQEWQERINKIKENILNPKSTLEAIDKLIDMENIKINDLNATTLID